MKLSRIKKPLYAQIANIVKDRILHGVYPVGTNIPTEQQLEQEFNVSKATVRGAIKELAWDGYVETGSGKGTKVIRNTSVSKLSKLKRFTEVLVEEGHRIRKQLLFAESAVNEAGSAAYHLFGERCLRIERVYYLNDQPYIHYTHYLSSRVGCPELPDLSEQSLYDLLEEQAVSLGKYRDEFSVSAAAPASVLAALRIEAGTPLLKRSRYAYEESGELIEYSEGYYHTEHHHYVVNYDV
ncbi:GntR family transcriptional regulator [Paenibacillus rhizovicinus]|uniref:GntR family transcriptional regulator n=1 Tax=Paenibacillus rhizovicinus TaxID=2704463 RepID=A0A6C0P0K5_9BACL|nr:GntR family transcriptional regulator [Paenibacillus rhizovicinus]QHW31911.1 GntR family transcriptional regulator [Paenibacillus rhizovicinus]